MSCGGVRRLKSEVCHCVVCLVWKYSSRKEELWELPLSSAIPHWGSSLRVYFRESGNGWGMKGS